MSFLDNWIDGNDASVCADNPPYSTWNEWDASQRDLYILDHEGNLVFHENVTDGLPSNLSFMIIDLISEIPGDPVWGDINGDEILNVLDVVVLVNWILTGDCSDEADMNVDGACNVLDVVILVNLILR